MIDYYPEYDDELDTKDIIMIVSCVLVIAFFILFISSVIAIIFIRKWLKKKLEEKKYSKIPDH